MAKLDMNESELLARRKLLKAAIYIPPVVLGSVMVGSTPAHAYTIGTTVFSVSGASNTCGPCQAVLNSTNPTINQLKQCVKDQCYNNCINCYVLYANLGVFGVSACSVCGKELNNGCATTCNTDGTCATCTSRTRKGVTTWRCR